MADEVDLASLTHLLSPLPRRLLRRLSQHPRLLAPVRDAVGLARARLLPHRRRRKNLRRLRRRPKKKRSPPLMTTSPWTMLPKTTLPQMMMYHLQRRIRITKWPPHTLEAY